MRGVWVGRGVHELFVGVEPEHVEEVVDYYAQFGFRPAENASLGKELASTLYGVSSSASVLRLRHGPGDGAVRLVAWSEPAGSGLGLSPLLAEGSRWATIRTSDLLAVANHAADALELGAPIAVRGPARNLIRRPAGFRPFLDPAPCIHELAIIRPTTRDMVFQRHDYESPVGPIDPGAHLAGSRFLHFALVCAQGRACPDFYVEAFGFARAEATDETATEASRILYGLRPELGEALAVTVLAPEAAPHAASTQVHLLTVSSPSLPDLRARSRPGVLGVSGYAVRVDDAAASRARVAAAGADAVTELAMNELGERSYSFTAPDGYWWNVLEVRCDGAAE